MTASVSERQAEAIRLSDSHPIVAARIRQEAPAALRYGVNAILDGKLPPFAFDASRVLGYIEAQFRKRGVTTIWDDVKQGAQGVYDDVKQGAQDAYDDAKKGAAEVADDTKETIQLQTILGVAAFFAVLYVGFNSGAFSAASDLASAVARKI